MRTTVDDLGRVLLPEPMRQRLGLSAGTIVDVSMLGDGLHIAPVARTARLERHDGRLVAVADTEVTDDDVFAVTDSVRR